MAFVQKQDEAISVYHNILVLPGLKIILSDWLCDMRLESGYIIRLEFFIGLMIGLRPTAMACMTLDRA